MPQLPRHELSQPQTRSGETSLERKCRLLFGTCLLVLIAGSFWWYGTATDRIVEYESVHRRSVGDYGMVESHMINAGRTIRSAHAVDDMASRPTNALADMFQWQVLYHENETRYRKIRGGQG